MCRAAGPSGEIRVAIIGLGGINVPGSVGGRGRQLLARFRAVPGVRVAALCDADRAILEHGVGLFTSRKEKVAAYGDPPQVFDDKSIDAVVVALPNFWHVPGRDLGLPGGQGRLRGKAAVHNIWEGKQFVAAARKYGRIVQTGTQSRSSTGLHQALDYLRHDPIGPMRSPTPSSTATATPSAGLPRRWPCPKP